MDQEPEENQQPVIGTESVGAEATNEGSNSSIEPVEESKAESIVEPKIESDTTQNHEPTKKTKTSLILIIVLLLLIGVGAWYLFFNNPDGDTRDNQISTEDQFLDNKSMLALKSNGLSDFDFAFLRMENNNENVIYSPLSIKYALGMLAEGAKDNSKTQIMDILGDYQPKAYINSANRSLANAMFVRTGSEFTNSINASYTDSLKNKFGAEIIYDSFKSPDNANKWVSDETLGIVQNIFDEETFNPETRADFVLLNALAIDMSWNNQLQCTAGLNKPVPCIGFYYVNYDHEKYSTYISEVDNGKFSKLQFNDDSEVIAAEIGASANRYDIINDLGEEYIRETVQKEYEKYLERGNKDEGFDIDIYIEQLAANNGQNKVSTDFYFYDSDDEKVFAKDLMEYDGSTLQYVGFMPKIDDLKTYINNMTAEKASDLIKNLKNAEDINSYKEDVITKIYAYIPFFKYDYDMSNFKNNLNKLGITDVFSDKDANLYGMIDADEHIGGNPYVMDALHKAAIDFSNDGIKAAAVTGVAGGRGAGGYFDYQWEVPVEEIDLTFDKPFFFLIRNKETGEIWFMGKVYNPEG